MTDDQQSDLSEYTVTINGIEHSMMLTEEDAKRYGDDAKKGGHSGDSPGNKSDAASDKARSPFNKGK